MDEIAKIYLTLTGKIQSTSQISSFPPVFPSGRQESQCIEVGDSFLRSNDGLSELSYKYFFVLFGAMMLFLSANASDQTFNIVDFGAQESYKQLSANSIHDQKKIYYE